MFYETDSRSLVLIDSRGNFGRVMALPRPQDFNQISSGGPVGTDAAGRLVYQGRGSSALFAPKCVPPGTPALAEQRRAQERGAQATDSVVIIRGNYDARSVDTVARVRAQNAEVPVMSYDVNCVANGAKIAVNPSRPSIDAWTVTASGAIAILRGHDYHIDWVLPDGSLQSTSKMPFDWRRISEEEKRLKVDSARRIIETLTANGGYRVRLCAGGRFATFEIQPTQPTGSTGSAPPSAGAGVAPVSGSAVGGVSDGMRTLTTDDCRSLPVQPDYVPLNAMADYVPPFREGSVSADLDGNVWIIPSTSLSARGGLLYDVVNDRGVIIERVQIPENRIVVAFGRDGVLYLSRGIPQYANGARVTRPDNVIEKVRIVR